MLLALGHLTNNYLIVVQCREDVKNLFHKILDFV